MFKRILALLLAFVLCMSIIACSNDTQGTPDNSDGSTPSGSTPTGDTEPELNKITDFEGYDFVIADWFSSESDNTSFNNSWEEFVYNYQQSISSEYNFTYSTQNISLTGSYTDLVPSKILSGDRDVSMYYFFEGYVVSSIAQGLLWDLTELDSFDPTDEKWNQISMEAFTFGDSIYAVDVAVSEPLMGMFYNKRLLEEAGLDPELPYQLQASGEWNWENFETILAKVTRDTNNDGSTDIWGFASTYGNMALAATWSNGASFVLRNEDGSFYDATNTAEFLESMEWLQKLSSNGWLMKKPSGGTGNYALEAFQQGTLAFLPYNFWLSEQTYLTDCVDEWGWVYLPYGPSAEGVTMCVQSYGYSIPKTFTKDEAEAIFQMFDLITDLTVDGSNNDWSIFGADEFEYTYWYEEYANLVRDTEALDETLYNMMFDTDAVTYDFVRMVSGYNYANYTSDIVNMKKTAQEKIEEMRSANQAAINSANSLLGYE